MEGENGGATRVLEEGISKCLQHSSLTSVWEHIFYYSFDSQDAQLFSSILPHHQKL